MDRQQALYFSPPLVWRFAQDATFDSLGYKAPVTQAKERQEKVTSTITLLDTIYRQNIKSIETLRHVLRILQTTIGKSLYKAGLLTWNKRH